MTRSLCHSSSFPPCIVFGAWEIAGRIPVSYGFPTFFESMVGAPGHDSSNGWLFEAYVDTLRPLVVGLVISGVHRNRPRPLDRAQFLVRLARLLPIFIVMQAAPLAALIPLLVMVYGIGLTSKVFVVCIMAMPVIVLNTAGSRYAMRQRASRKWGARFLATDRDIILKVVLPSASPIIFLRIAPRHLRGIHRRHPVRAENHSHR